MPKICRTCKKELSDGCFHKNKQNKDGLNGLCKQCEVEYKHQYYLSNKEKLSVESKSYRNAHKEEMRLYNKQYRKEHRNDLIAYNKQYYNDNKEEFSLTSKIYKDKNKDKLSQYHKEYRDSHKEERRVYEKNNRISINITAGEYRKKRMQEDPQFKLACNLRSKLSAAIRGHKKFDSAINILGMSINDFKSFLESKFQPGMTWDNYGVGYGKWHDDHIIPIAYFDFGQKDQVRQCFHYTNMRPMWGSPNISKNSWYNGVRWTYKNRMAVNRDQAQVEANVAQP
jgi:hypothetical protein